MQTFDELVSRITSSTCDALVASRAGDPYFTRGNGWSTKSEFDKVKAVVTGRVIAVIDNVQVRNTVRLALKHQGLAVTHKPNSNRLIVGSRTDQGARHE